MSTRTTALKNAPGHAIPGGAILIDNPDRRPSPRLTIGRIADHAFGLTTLDFGFAIEKHGFIHDIVTHLPVTRLNRIHQLQKLTWLRVEDGYERLSGRHTFGHNRLVHSLWSAVTRARANQYLGLTGPDALVGILIEAIHDLFTSAGGDIMKVMNPGLFDEDKLIVELFSAPEHREGWERLQKKYDLPRDTPERVYEALQGRGLDGELHEVFDTWSYLANDLDAILRAFRAFKLDIAPYFGETIQALGNRALGIWQHVGISSGRAYVTDPDILTDFLRLRVELWRQLYCHPGNKTIELFYRRIMLPYFFRKRKIEQRQLLLWDDDKLAHTMRETLLFPNMMSVNVGESWPEMAYFSDWESARQAEDRARHAGNLTMLTSLRGDQPVKPKTTKYLIKGPKGTILPFREAHPEKAAAIETLAATPPCERIQLITYPRAAEVFSRPILESWHEARAGWDTEPEFGVKP